MAMSQGDFVKFAQLFAGEAAIGDSFSDADSRIVGRMMARNIILSSADIMAQSNPRFDRAKFYAASNLHLVDSRFGTDGKMREVSE